MHRFYLSDLNFSDQKLLIQDSRIVFQASKVLRMKHGSFFHLFNEKEEWLVQVETIDRKKLSVQQVSSIQNDNDAQLKVALYQAIPKKPALFELILQKATEIGVTDIYPLITERTENRRLTKLDRLKIIALEATEQCGRKNIPHIHHPVNYDEIVPQLTHGYIAYEYEGNKYLSDYPEIEKADELQIIIGPEGGLSESEISLAKDSGIKSFSLGKRILRTETAALAALTLVLLKK